MQVASGSGCARTFTCRYHGWTYNLDGRLRHIPHEDGFPGFDKDAHPLVPVTATERMGLVFVTQGEPALDGDGGGDPLGGESLDEWVMPEARAALWDPVIGWIKDGTIKPGSYTNFIYARFLEDPLGQLEKSYRELGLNVDPQTFANMKEWLGKKAASGHGNSQKYQHTAPDDPALAAERALYKRYQDFFDVPNEDRSAS